MLKANVGENTGPGADGPTLTEVDYPWILQDSGDGFLIVTGLGNTPSVWCVDDAVFNAPVKLSASTVTDRFRWILQPSN